MLVRPVCGWTRAPRIAPLRPFGLRVVGCPPPPIPAWIAAETIWRVEHRPRPPFSLSGTIQVLQFSNSFAHFVAGELLLALLLRSRTEWSRRYHPQPAVDNKLGDGSCLPLAAQANEIASIRLDVTPTAEEGASGNTVGSRLDLFA